MGKTVKKPPLAVCTICGRPKEYELPNGQRVRVICQCTEQAEQQAQQRQYAEHIAELKQRIPAEYRNFTFENDDGQDPKTTAVLKRYVNKFETLKNTGQGLLLFGYVGTGKTYGAMCIANALASKGYRVGCTTLAKIISNAQDWDNAAYLFNEILSNQVIIIDDLGTQRTTEFANEQVYQFIDECTKKNRHLIITTNLTPSIFQQAIDKAKTENDLAYARIYSRILERCYPIVVNNINRRTKNQVQRKQTMQAILRGTNEKRTPQHRLL